MRTNEKLTFLLEEAIQGLKSGKCELSETAADSLISAMSELVFDKPKLDFMTREQVCDYLGITPPTLYRRIANNEIPKGIHIQGLTQKVWDRAKIEEVKEKGMMSD